MTKQIDNLPLDGEVYVKGDVRVYLYRGFLAGNFDQCAVQVKGETSSTWVDRSKIMLPEQTHPRGGR